MAVSIYAKLLPKDMVDEAREYQRLYRNNLTTEGLVKFKSISSGQTYTSHGGQQGLFNILKKTLRDYIIGLGAEPKTPLATLTAATGTWTVPSEITQVDVFMVSGGKSGYDGALSDCRFIRNLAVTPGDEIDFSVGTAGGTMQARTTTFGEYTVQPSEVKAADLDHYYNPYDNTMYYPWKITEAEFGGQFNPPYEDYTVIYGADGTAGSDGSDGFIGGKGGDAAPGKNETVQETDGGNGGDGYIGGSGGRPGQGLTRLKWEKEGTGLTSADYTLASGTVPTARTGGGDGGTGVAQGGDGGKGAGAGAYLSEGSTGYAIYRCRPGLPGGNGGDGGNGGNGGDGGNGTKVCDTLLPAGNGGNGGDATRWGGTGGNPGKGGSIVKSHVVGNEIDRNDTGGSSGTYGAGKQGVILIYAEQRAEEE